jgi:bifunctional non-homologous end joining protein LigD
VDEALIDGEAVLFQDDGRSDFHALLIKRSGAQAAFVAFDILRREGDDVRLWPIEARREKLIRLVAKRHGDGILFSEALAAEGVVVFATARTSASKALCRSGRAAFYKSGPSRSWLKTKNPDFVRT